ncbi:MAG: glycosyltransferase [Verrucomicrobiota bacterium]
MHRILVVVPYYKPAYVYGGPVRSVPALCEGLSQLGCEVTVLTTNANGNSDLDLTASEDCMVDGVKVCYCPREKSPLLFYSPTLRQACNQQIPAYDLVYIVSCWSYPFVAATQAAAKAHIPYLISPRTAFMHATWERKFLKKAIYHCLVERKWIARAAAIHYTSQIELDQSRWLRLQSKPVIVPNPVDMSDFATSPQRGSFRERYGIAAEEQVLLYIGRVESRKGLDLAIRAFGRSASSRRQTRFVIAGPEENMHMRALKRLAKCVGVADRMLFTGILLGGVRLGAFRDADLLVLTSKGENFAMSVVEAMAAGIPVLVTDTVGVSTDVAAHGAGLVVPREVNAVAAAMDRLLSSAELRRKFGEAGKAFATVNYALDAVAGLWLERFKNMFKNRNTE